MRILAANNYTIKIGEESISSFNFSEYSQVSVLVDENTKKNCLPILLKKNKTLKDPIIVEIKSGEENKNISSCNFIWEQLINNNFDKDSLFINLGGGVIGDMGGYCASTYKRGIEFIHIPTTLLAMVDASIGGKLSVNFQDLKNQIGLFKNPKSVLIYPGFLETLEESQLKSGFAEILKHILIADKEKWDFLQETNFKDLEWENIISHSVNIKNTIVMSDSLEYGDRKKLNFGHTFGHAIESYYLKKENPILHGEAVFMGMLLELELSNLTTIEKVDIKNYILSNFDLPHLPEKDNLIRFMKNDKKNRDDRINFSLLEGIGDCTINNFFSEDEL